MEERSDQGQPPERIPVEKIRAELRAAGLLKHLDESRTPPSGQRPPREAKIIPFRRIDDKPVVRRNWKRPAALILYALLALAMAALMLR